MTAEKGYAQKRHREAREAIDTYVAAHATEVPVELNTRYRVEFEIDGRWHQPLAALDPVFSTRSEAIEFGDLYRDFLITDVQRSGDPLPQIRARITITTVDEYL